MKERLVELLSKHQKICNENCTGLEKSCYRCSLEQLADYILADGWTRPPCKLGDTVYRVITMGTGVTFKKVGRNIYREMEQTIKHFIRCVTVTKNNYLDVCENFGKTVFLTREEAQAKLKEGGEG